MEKLNSQEDVCIDKALNRFLIRARLILLWERLEIAFWKPFSLLATFSALLLSGFVPSHPWIHTFFLGFFLISFLVLLVRGFRSLRVPSRQDAERFLESASGLAHRPLQTLSDRPGQDDAVSLAVWKAHCRRVGAQLSRLSTGMPRPQLAGRDPFGLRILAIFFLVIATGSSGFQVSDRLLTGLYPDFSTSKAMGKITLDAWLSPPDYTGIPPKFLARAADRQSLSTQTINDFHEIPVGTVLTLQLGGSDEISELITPAGSVPLSRFADQGLSIEHEVQVTASYALTLEGETVAAWNLVAIADQPPFVHYTKPPEESLRKALTIHYSVTDDYGIVELRAVIERADEAENPAQSDAKTYESERIDLLLPVPGRDQYGEERRVFRDLIAHPWAGGKVHMTLVAKDRQGQTGRTEKVEFTLPVRDFIHPVAAAIAELRRELAWDPHNRAAFVAEALNDLAWEQEAYDHHITVFLALKEAARSLEPVRSGKAIIPSHVIEKVVTLLWKTALYLEDGGTFLALERLRAAEQALMEALKSGADQAELNRLMNALQNAMNDYMKAMGNQMHQTLEEGISPPVAAQGQMITPDDINRMLNEMREMMQNGMMENAAQMLDRLRQIMENMQAGLQPRISDEDQQAMGLLEDLQNIMQDQRYLIDQTFENARQQHPQAQSQNGSQEQGQNQSQNQTLGQAGGRQSDGLLRNGDGASRENSQSSHHADQAAFQENLRRRLAEVMRKFGEMMGEIPDGLGHAEEAMGEASESLGNDDPAGALPPQNEAMNSLRQAAEETRNALMERFDRQMGTGQQMPGEPGALNRDPFGRQRGNGYGANTQSDTSIPDEERLERSRKIRDELRKRAGDRTRPEKELDYIDRLLDQFN